MLARLLVAAQAGLVALPAFAQEPPAPPEDAASDFAFLAAPQTDLNRMYRVDRASGEMGSCQYAVKQGSVGVTLCFPPGEGAGPQDLGEYELVTSNHGGEAGVYRVDRRTGRMSICYVLGEQVVCTPQAR